MPKGSDKLNARQRLFVAAYVADPNGKQAAIKAGYSAAGAEVTASKLLRVPKVKAAVDAALGRTEKAAEVERSEILRELKRIALADIGGAFDSEGRLLPIHQMPEEIRRTISGVEVDQLFDGEGPDKYQAGDTVKVKFWDKPKSLELLGKHLKLWTDKLDLNGRLTLDQLLAEGEAGE